MQFKSEKFSLSVPINYNNVTYQLEQEIKERFEKWEQVDIDTIRLSALITVDSDAMQCYIVATAYTFDGEVLGSIRLKRDNLNEVYFNKDELTSLIQTYSNSIITDAEKLITE